MDPEDLSATEREALHELQLGIEHVHRGFGALLDCHHEVGNGTDHFEVAMRKLRDAGHDDYADELRDEILPGGAFDDHWTYELVEAFRDGFLAETTEFEAAVRDDLVDGTGHVSERRQQREWRERAHGWTAGGRRDDGEGGDSSDDSAHSDNRNGDEQR